MGALHEPDVPPHMERIGVILKYAQTFTMIKEGNLYEAIEAACSSLLIILVQSLSLLGDATSCKRNPLAISPLANYPEWITIAPRIGSRRDEK